MGNQKIKQEIKQILISTTAFAEFDKTPLTLLEENGFNYSLNPYRRKLKATEIIELAKEAVGIIAGTERLSDDIFSHLQKLKVISRCGSGMDNVDLQSAQKRGIKVYNTPDGPTRAVAELTVGVILNLLRHINQTDRIIRDGNWKKEMGNLLYGKKVGIIGFGRIGQKVCELLSAFGVELSYCDIEPKSCPINCSQKTLKEILTWADILTLHLSCSGGSKYIMGKRELSLMKQGSWLINLSRGGVVDEKALYDALKNGHLCGAAMDVFEQEPYDGPLRGLDNIILTPHIGSYAKEARIKMEIQAVENLLKGLKEDNK
ncbi:MAG: phosphoglycerate dehydrogenase [Candidatus Omnitrophica bacterium]|nr:phosphoglycerate dehydrogenase [Candidatus Omnitrophota bacterium]